MYQENIHVHNGYVHVVTRTAFACRKTNFFMKAIDFLMYLAAIVQHCDKAASLCRSKSGSLLPT